MQGRNSGNFKPLSFIIFLFLLLTPLLSYSASFLAEYHEVQNGKTTISKFFLYDNLYRIDVKEGGLTLTMLVNRESGKTRVLDPSQKVYRELNNDDMMSLIKNPFEAYQHMVKTDTVIALGKEIVNNIVCDKQAIEKNGKKVMTVWLSSKHNFPIKIENNLNGDIAELQGVRKIPLDPDFFKVPADFVKVQAPKSQSKKPQSEKPEKKIVITGKETFKAPIGRRIGHGGVLSVTVNPEKHIQLVFYNENKGEPEIMIKRFKNNAPVAMKHLRKKIIRFNKNMDKTEYSLDKLPNPDSLEITVTKGMAYVIVNQESPMWEKELSQECFIKKPAMLGFLTKPKQKIIVQLIGDNQDKPESKLIVKFFKDKYKIPILSEEISLRNGQSRQWDFDADHKVLSGTVEVQQGSVQFSLNQPAQSKKTSTTQRQQPVKEVQSFSINAPLGTSKTVDPKKPLLITIKGMSQQTKGSIFLYKDLKKTQKIDSQRIDLSKGESKSWTYSAEKQAAKVSFFVSKGDFNVELNQNQGAISSLLASKIESASATPGKPEPQIIPKPDAQDYVKPIIAKKVVEEKTSEKNKPSVEKITDPARMMLVFDASGSMWGQMEGKAKITIAKEVLAELIDAIPSSFYTGLTVYGHRRKGDCKDIEMIIPVSPHNAAAMKAKINAINPKGKTPLSESVRQAALALRYVEERATVILVSDGLETCDVDPCELAAELAMTGVDFTVHVVGFGISKEEQAYLRCLADKTGGLFLAADNAGALRDALFKTIDKVKEDPLPVVEDPGIAELKGPDSAPAGSVFNVSWQGPDSLNDYIAIVKKGSDDAKRDEYTYTKTGNPLKIIAPGEPGDYELRYIHSHSHQVIGRADIKITPVEAELTIPSNVTVGADFEISWKGPGYKNDFLTVALPEASPDRRLDWKIMNGKNPIKLTAPGQPGDYEVRYILFQDRKIIARAALNVEPAGASVTPPESANVGSKILVAWQGPGNRDDFITISEPDAPEDKAFGRVLISSGNPVKLKVPGDPGDYEVRYILFQGRKILARAPITLKPVTAIIKAPATVKAGTDFFVEWEGPGGWDDFLAIAHPSQPPNNQVKFAAMYEKSPVKMRAPSEPGTYEVRYILFIGRKLLGKTTIQVIP